MTYRASDYVAVASMKLPFTKTEAGATNAIQIQFASAKTAKIAVTSLAYQMKGSSTAGVRVLAMGDSNTILFSGPVIARLELEFFAEAGTRIYLSGMRGSERFKTRLLEPASPGLFTWSSEVDGIQSLEISGAKIFLTSLVAIPLTDAGASPWVLLSTADSLRLPYGYTDAEVPAYLATAPGTPDYKMALNRWRLNTSIAGTLYSPIQFAKLRSLLAELFITGRKEGTEVPAGYCMMPSTADSAGENDPAMGLPVSSLLEMQSLNYGVSLALGLGFQHLGTNKGEYFDYKVEANWPKGYLSQLSHSADFDDLATGSQAATFSRGELVFHQLSAPQVKANSSGWGNTANTLAINPISTSSRQTWIYFTGAQKEVQLFLKHAGTSLKVDFYRIDRIAPEKKSYTAAEAFVAFADERIDKICITGVKVEVCRVDYDRESCSDFTLSAVVYGLRVVVPAPVEIPSNVQTARITLAQGALTPEPAGLAALSWNYAEVGTDLLFEDEPVSFHIRRSTGTGSPELLTPNGPLFVNPLADAGTYVAPEGWPSWRPLFRDPLSNTGTYQYAVSGTDLWGRQSEWCAPKSFVLKSRIPPPPTGLYARFLEYPQGINNQEYSAAETALLTAKGESGIYLKWKWTQELQGLCPDSQVTGFRIHFQKGFLNLYNGIFTAVGMKTAVTKAALGVSPEDEALFAGLKGSGVSLETYTCTLTLDDFLKSEVNFKRAWLKQKGNTFLVIKSRLLSATVFDKYEVVLLAPAGIAFAVPQVSDRLSIEVGSDRPGYINYALAANWKDVSITATEPFVALGTAEEKTYEVFIKTAALKPVTGSPAQFGQIAVSSYNADEQGSVCPPATVMGVQRSKPTALPAASLKWGTGTASPPDIHGKCSYVIRWKKSGGNTRYKILRAIDSGLAKVDQARTGRPNSYYEGLTDAGWATLAGSAANVGAFVQVNDTALDENDSRWQDRVTELPPSGGTLYVPSTSWMLFEDRTLDAAAGNRYFYRIQKVDSTGNPGDLSAPGTIVRVPRYARPVPPTVESIKGGDLYIDLEWAHPGDDALSGFCIYRSEDESLARDIRLMTQLSVDSSGLSAGRSKRSFRDNTAEAGKIYYYRLSAVATGSKGLWLESDCSPLFQGQAYDASVPPAAENLAAVKTPDSIVQVSWTCRSHCRALVMRNVGGMDLPVTGWMEDGVYNSVTGLWEYLYEDKGICKTGGSATYYVITERTKGIRNTSTSITYN